jgi:hypothetical protein
MSPLPISTNKQLLSNSTNKQLLSNSTNKKPLFNNISNTTPLKKVEEENKNKQQPIFNQNLNLNFGKLDLLTTPNKKEVEGESKSNLGNV